MVTDDDLIAKLTERAHDETRRIGATLSFGLPPLEPPASDALIHQTEAALGAGLPPLLRRLYAEVANGGFGPGYGLLRLGEGGLRDPESRTPSSTYLEFRSGIYPERRLGGWPDRVLPLWDWGGATWKEPITIKVMGVAKGRPFRR